MVEPFGASIAFILLSIGVGLILAEAIVPGANFIVIGIALFISGLTGVLIPQASSPLILASIILLVGAITFYVYQNYELLPGENGKGKTRDATDLLSEEGYVTDTVTQMSGEVKLQNGGFNPYYQARSIDETIEEGTKIIVVETGGGNVVTVVQAEEFN